MKKVVLAALCSGAFTLIVTLGLRGPAGAPDEAEPEAEATPDGPVDGSPEAAYGYALAREKTGDLETAAEYYLRALELDPTYAAARSKVLSMPESVKAHEERRIGAHLLALFTRLVDEKRDAEARALAPLVLRMNPENERAHLLSGDELIAGQWVPKDDAELMRISEAKTKELAAYARLSVREKKIHDLKEDYDNEWSLGKDDREWLDCAPDAPFVICLEKSDQYNASLLLKSFQADAKTFFDQFCGQFGMLFSADVLCSSEVCPIYVFSSRERYLACTLAPDYLGGHFDAKLGWSFLYRDAPAPAGSLFHEFTHQLVHAISGVKNGAPLVPAPEGECWFLEGLTSYFEGFTRDTKGRTVFGVPPGELLAAAKKRIAGGWRYKLEDLMHVTFRQLKREAAGDSWKATGITAQCWAATYFLLTYADGKYRDRYLEYFKLELNGKGGFAAAKRCFGDLGAMDREYEDYFRTLK